MAGSEIVLVGSGMGCLVAATRLLARGHSVRVLEQADRAGGYFGGFENEAGDRFDLAVSHLLGGAPGDPLREWIDALDLGDAIPLDPVDIADVIWLGDRRIEMPTGLERLRESLGREFPASDDDLDAVVEFLRAFLGTSGADSRAAGRFMMRNFRRGFEDFCIETVADPELRTALAIRIQCDDSSLMIMTGFLTEVYGKGMVHPRGGVRRLVDAVVERIREAGGKVELDTEATDLRIEDGVATGVVLADGSVHAADAVLFGGDGPTLTRLLAAQGVPTPDDSGRQRGHSSLSVFATLVGADLSRFGTAARHYLTDTPDVFATYRTLERGDLPEHPVVKVHLASRIDPSLAGAGRDLVRIEVDMYHDEARHDEAFYEEYAERTERFVSERLLSELATHRVYRRVVTPIDYSRWFSHAGGSATGWAHDVDNYMVRRIAQRTGVPNVLITGQWGEFGSGLPQLIASADRSVALAEQWLRKRAAV